MKSIIRGLILACTLIVLTGYGMLTMAVFNISETTVFIPGAKNQAIVDWINAKPINTLYYTEQNKANNLNTVPTNVSTNTGGGQYLIDLSGVKLNFAKMSILVFWVLVPYILYKLLKKND